MQTSIDWLTNLLNSLLRRIGNGSLITAVQTSKISIIYYIMLLFVDFNLQERGSSPSSKDAGSEKTKFVIKSFDYRKPRFGVTEGVAQYQPTKKQLHIFLIFYKHRIKHILYFLNNANRNDKIVTLCVKYQLNLCSTHFEHMFKKRKVYI